MTGEPLIAHRAPGWRVVVRGRSPLAGQFVAAALALAQRLPPAQYVLNSCRDRYHFAVAFCAALIAGRTSLLPPSRTPETLAQLATRYPDTLYLGEGARRPRLARFSSTCHEVAGRCGCKSVAATGNRSGPRGCDRVHVGQHRRTAATTENLGRIVDGACAEVIALHLDDATIDEVVLVGTVSPQHMYGFESTVLLALHGPCAFAAEHPLHPDEVVAVLSRISGRRVLITAPVHLRALAESAHSMPVLDRVVSATAPLTPNWRSGANRCGGRACSRCTAAPRPAWWRRGARSLARYGQRCST